MHLTQRHRQPAKAGCVGAPVVRKKENGKYRYGNR
jgi:hypothetical protein